MPRFLATVKLTSGETQFLEREADSQAALLKVLRSEGFVPVQVEEASKQEAFSLHAVFGGKGRPRPKTKDLQGFMCGFATLLRSGMDLDRCLRTLQKESREPLSTVASEIAERIRHGENLSDAMARTGMFSPFHIRVIRAGEHSGNIHRAFDRIARTIEKESEAKGRIRNAVAYPAFLVVFGIISFFIMLIAILPKFTGIYDEMGTELPILTKILLKGSGVLRAHALWLVPSVLIGGCFGIRSLFRFRNSVTIDRFRMRIPVLGSIIRDMQSAAFMRTFALLLQSGLPVTEALHICGKVANSAIFANAAKRIEKGVQKGGRISSEMRSLDLFSETILNLVAVGEESGRLSELMLETSDDMERRMDQLVRGALALLEPVLILVIGAIIGLMVVAMMLPIFSLGQGLRG